MIYIFATILIVFNGVILLAFKSDGYTLSLYMNLFNVLLLPLLYLIISKREALASVGLNADVKRGAIGTKVLSALKQPIVFIVFAFPLIFGLFIHQVDSQDFLNYFILIVLHFLVGLNLLALAALFQLYFKKQYSFLITTPGVLWAALISLNELKTQYLLYFGIGLLVITSLLVILVFYLSKPVEIDQNRAN